MGIEATVTNRQFFKYLTAILVFGLLGLYFNRDSGEMILKIGLATVLWIAMLVWGKYEEKQAELQLQNAREEEALAKAYDYPT